MAGRMKEGKKDKWRGPKKLDEWYSHASPRAESFNSQEHVLLILLKDSADVLEDLWVKEVYTTVYDVAHKCAWLFHIMQDLERQ